MIQQTGRYEIMRQEKLRKLLVRTVLQSCLNCPIPRHKLGSGLEIWVAIILLKPATNETRTLIKSEGYNSFSIGCFIPLSYMGDLEGQFEITNSMSMINPKILENSCT